MSFTKGVQAQGGGGLKKQDKFGHREGITQSGRPIFQTFKQEISIYLFCWNSNFGKSDRFWGGFKGAGTHDPRTV